MTTQTLKVTQLPNAGVLSGTELVPIVQAGTTKQVTTQQIADLFTGPGSGTVTSVALSAPSIFSVTGSPITGAGTLALALANQSANRIFAGPGTGADAAPTFRALVAADIPNGLPSGGSTGQVLAKASGTNYDATWIADTGGTVTSVGLSAPSAVFSVTGTPVTTTGTLALGLATQSANVIFAGPSSGGAAEPTFRSIVANDLPIVPITKGGTGQTTASAAFDALAPTTTRGDLIFRNATTNTRLAASTSGYLLQTNGAGTDPTWAGFLQSGTGAATRTWQTKNREIVSLLDFAGADNTGTTVNDTAFTNAVGSGFKEVWIPPGTYKFTPGFHLTGVNNVHLVGAESGGTVFTASGDGHVMWLTDAQGWIIENIAFRHASGASGDGLRFDGTSSGNIVRICTITDNPGYGLAFVGGSGSPQSENNAEGNVILRNSSGNLYWEYSNDFYIVGNVIGGTIGGPYPTFGSNLLHSSQGLYQGNEHWDQTQGAVFDTCLGLRIIGNRFEQSRNEGVYFTTCDRILFSSNVCHTNSKSATGTYAQVKITDTTQSVFGLTKMFSENAGSYQTSYGFQCTGTTNNVQFTGNDIDDYVTARISVGSATAYSIVDRVQAYLTADSASTAVGVTVNNPSTTDFHGTAYDLRVSGIVRTRMLAQRDSSGGQFILQVPDSGGSLQSYLVIDKAGNYTGATTLTLPNTGLHLLDTNASHDLIIKPGSDVTADRTLTLTTGDADRTLTLSGNATVSQDYSTSGTPTFAALTITGASASVFSIENTSAGSFATIYTDYRVAGAVRARVMGQRDGTGTGGYLYLSTQDSGGTVQDYVQLAPTGALSSKGAVLPFTDDGAALGNAATKRWSDLFLASGGVINWNNGTFTLTQSGSTLTSSGTIATTDLTVTNAPRFNQTPSAIGTGAKTISNAADSSTNFGHYLALNMNGTTYYVPCSAVAPT